MVLAAPPPSSSSSSSSCLVAAAAAPAALVASSSSFSVGGSGPGTAAAPATRPRWVPVEKDFRTSNGALWAFVTTSYQTVTLKTQGTVTMPVYSSLGAGQYGRVFEVRRADGGAGSRSGGSGDSSRSQVSSLNPCRTQGNVDSSSASNGNRNSSSSSSNKTSSSHTGSRNRNTRSRQSSSTRDYPCCSIDTKDSLDERQEEPAKKNAVPCKRCNSIGASKSSEEAAARTEEAAQSSFSTRLRSAAACAAQGSWATKTASGGEPYGVAREVAEAAAAEKRGVVQIGTAVETAVDSAARVGAAPIASKLESAVAAAATEERDQGRLAVGAAAAVCTGDGATAEGAAEAGEQSRPAGRATAAAAAPTNISGRMPSACAAGRAPRDAAGPATTASPDPGAGEGEAGSRQEAEAAVGNVGGAARPSHTASLAGERRRRAPACAGAAAATEEERKEEEKEAATTKTGLHSRGRGGGGRTAAATAAEVPNAAAPVSCERAAAQQKSEEVDANAAAQLHGENAEQPLFKEGQRRRQDLPGGQLQWCCCCARWEAAGKRGAEHACDMPGGEEAEEPPAAEGDNAPRGEAAPAAAPAKRQPVASPLLKRDEEPAAVAGRAPATQVSGGKEGAGERILTLQQQSASVADADGGSYCCEKRDASNSHSSKTSASTRATAPTKRSSSRGAALPGRSSRRSSARIAAACSNSSDSGSSSASAAAATHSTDARPSCGSVPAASAPFVAANSNNAFSSSSTLSSCSSAAGAASASRTGSGDRKRSSSSRAKGPLPAAAAVAAPPEEEETRYAAKLFLLADYETDGITADVLRELSFYNAFSCPSPSFPSSSSSSSGSSGCASCTCSSSSAFLASSCSASSSLCPPPSTSSSAFPSSAFCSSPAPPPGCASALSRCCCSPPPFPNFPACFGCLACMEVSAEFSEGYLNGVRYCSVIVVEKCRADLATFVKGLWAQERMNISALKFYVWQLLNGVAKLHNQNIAHRDLKPENLLVAAANIANGQQLYDGGVAVVKIADLGMGRKVRWELSQQAAGSSSQVFASKQQPAAGLLDRGPAAVGTAGAAAASASAAAAVASAQSSSASAASAGGAAAASFVKGSGSSITPFPQTLRPLFSEEKLMEAADRMRQSGHVITLPYRPPELLVTDPSRQNSARCPIAEYGLSCDLWSLGVIILEMCLPQHLPRPPYRWQYAFVLHDARKASYQMEVMILENIFKVTGRPSAEELARITREAGAQQAEGLHAFLSAFPQLDTNSRKLSINDFIVNRGGLQLDELGLDLLARLLHISPNKRLSAQCALAHPWFHDLPYQEMNQLGLVSHLAELASPQLRRALPTAVRHCVMWWESTGRSVLHTQFAMHGLLHHMLLEEQRTRLRAAQQEPPASPQAHPCVVRQHQQRSSHQRSQQHVPGRQQDTERQQHQQQAQQQPVEQEDEKQQQSQQQQQSRQPEGLPELGMEEDQQHRRRAGVLHGDSEQNQPPFSAYAETQQRQGGPVFGDRQQQHACTGSIILQQQQQPRVCVSKCMGDIRLEQQDLNDDRRRQQQQLCGVLAAGDAELQPQQQQGITDTIVSRKRQRQQHSQTVEQQQQQQSMCEAAPASTSVPEQHGGHACLLLLHKQLSEAEKDTNGQCRCSAGAASSAASRRSQQSDRRPVARDEQSKEAETKGRDAASGETDSEKVTAEGNGENEQAVRNKPQVMHIGATVLCLPNGEVQDVSSAPAQKKRLSSDSATDRAAVDPGESSFLVNFAEDGDESVWSLQKHQKVDASSLSSAARASRTATVPGDDSSSAAPSSQTVNKRLSLQGRGCREGSRGGFLSLRRVRAAPALPLLKGDAGHAMHAVHVLQQQQHRIVHPTGAESDDELVRSCPRNGHSPLCETQTACCGSTSSLELPLLSSPKPRVKTLLVSGAHKSAEPSTRYGRACPAHSAEGCSATSTCRCSPSCKADGDLSRCYHPSDATEQFSPAVDSKSPRYRHCTRQPVATCCSAQTMCACPTTTSSEQADHDSATSCQSTFYPGDCMRSSVQPSCEDRAAATGERGCLHTSNVERGCSAAA